MLAVDNCVNADYLDLVVVFSDDGKVECFNRYDLIETIEQEGKCDYSSAVLIKKFHNFSLFQKYFLQGVCHYRPIKGTVQSYIDGVLSSSMIEKKGNKVEKNELGKGEYGTVIRYGDSTIAVKISNPPFIQNLKTLVEYGIMKLLQQSPCCNAFAYDMTINSKGASLYMKSMKGSLNSFLNELNGREKEIMFDICKGIYYAHSMGILHRDLKMENILIDSKGGANVADWGLSGFKPYIDNINFNVQTLTYRAPEVMFPFLFDNRYSYPIDIFSLGVLGIELYTKMSHSTAYYEGGDKIDSKELEMLGLGKYSEYVSIIVKNIYGISTKKQLMDIAEEKLPVVYMQNSVSDKTAYALFSSMMSNRPEDRPTISQVLNHPYFDDVRNDEKFPQIKEADIFSRIPTLLISGTGDLFFKVEAMRMISKAFPHDAIKIFHTINMYNQYTSVYPPMNDKNNELNVKAFINIVSLFRTGEEVLYINDELETEMKIILKRLKYEFIRAVPIMYFKILTPLIIRMLLAFELSNYRDIHPYHVAEFIAKRGREYAYVSQKKSYKTPDVILEELLMSACSTKEKEEQIEKLLPLINK